MASLRRVALLVETSRAYGRGLLRGIAQYHAEQQTWLTFFQPHGLGDPPPAWLKQWNGHGVIARIDNRRLAASLSALRVPVVNLRSTMANLPFPFIGTNNQAVAELAANHLLEKGLRHFAFFELRRKSYPGFERRLHWFRHVVEQAGCTCDVFESDATPTTARSRHQYQKQLHDWIKRLQKPVGIMAGNDDHGLQVLEACRQMNLAVPDQVAVIGVDNDECLCNLSIPTLTSVELDCERIGYEAATLLDRLMAGRPAPPKLDQINPRGVVCRASTDLMAVDDVEVSQAIQFIRENACRGIHVSDVFKHVGASRSKLEAKLRQVLRRTVHQEIQRIQVERTKSLLRDSALPIKQVAEAAGFSTVQYMTRLFGAATGETPAHFRRRNRLGNP